MNTRVKRALLGIACGWWLLGGWPAQAISVLGDLSHERTIEPGKTYEGTILLKNNSKVAEEVKVYQTDYQFFADGRNLYGRPGKDARSNAAWVTFSPNYLTVPPQATLSIAYTVRVPADPARAGTFWSMLMVEGVPKVAPAQQRKQRPEVGLRQAIRYGVQIVTNIGDSGSRKIKILDKRLLRDAGRRLLRLDIANTGERWLRPVVWVNLVDSAGRRAGRFTGIRKRIFPGSSVRHDIELANVPPGAYKAVIVIDNGDDYVFGAQHKIAF